MISEYNKMKTAVGVVWAVLACLFSAALSAAGETTLETDTFRYVIAEDGTYEELLAQGGLFAELVARQRLDSDQ